MRKTCIECNIKLPLDNFNKGRNQCKLCVKNKRMSKTCIECNIRLPLDNFSKGHNQCKLCIKNKNKCSHGIRKARCRQCGGNQICIHDKEKSTCRECDGSSFCEHNKLRYYCIICTPKHACQECKSVRVEKRSMCYPLCQPCFCNTYPDHEKSTLYKIKERYLRDELRVRFPDNNINIIFDKAVDGGCSKKRPDVLIDLLLYSIIIECDEDQHKNYECENKRTMQLFEDLGKRPLILIRFNPDSYTEKRKKIKGCFEPLTNIEDIHKKKFYDINKEEWKRRIDILEEVIKGKISSEIPEKEIEEIKLFYNKI